MTSKSLASGKETEGNASLTKYYTLCKVILTMQYVSNVTQKGQATIPAPVRKKLGIKPNGKVAFTVRRNAVLIKPVVDFFTLRGSIKSRKKFNIDAMDKAVLKGVAKEYGQDSNRH